jgi:hypothetical protein
MAKEWGEILMLVSNLPQTNQADVIKWRWDSNGCFNVRSLYRFLNFRGVQQEHTLLWWGAPIPHKIKVFMWLLTKKKILTKVNLAKRGWNGELKCQFCNMEDLVDHLIIGCRYSRTVWVWMGVCQEFLVNWYRIEDILEYTNSLNDIR